METILDKVRQMAEKDRRPFLDSLSDGELNPSEYVTFNKNKREGAIQFILWFASLSD
jgi:hypothetical protein